MKDLRYSEIFFIVALCLFPALVQAHPHHVERGGGFMSGLSHPVLGLDHLLAMIAVGVLGAQMGERPYGWCRRPSWD